MASFPEKEEGTLSKQKTEVQKSDSMLNKSKFYVFCFCLLLFTTSGLFISLIRRELTISSIPQISTHLRVKNNYTVKYLDRRCSFVSLGK